MLLLLVQCRYSSILSSYRCHVLQVYRSINMMPSLFGKQTVGATPASTAPTTGGLFAFGSGATTSTPAVGTTTPSFSWVLCAAYS